MHVLNACRVVDLLPPITLGLAALSRRMAVLALLALGCLFLPCRADASIDYGLSLVDNSAGGTVMDNYVTQDLWTATDGPLSGVQLRIELDEGAIFQDTYGDSSFSFGAPHELFVSEQPSLAFDTYVGLNGAQPGLVVGSAANLGDRKQYRFDQSGIDVAWSPGPGNLSSGHFDLGRITLSKEAYGRGALLLSSDGQMLAHVFEIRDGTIHLADEPILPVQGHLELDDDFQQDELMRHYRNQMEQESKSRVPPQQVTPPIVEDDPPVVTEPPRVDPAGPELPADGPEDPFDPTGEPIGSVEEPIVEPQDPIVAPSEPIGSWNDYLQIVLPWEPATISEDYLLDGRKDELGDSVVLLPGILRSPDGAMLELVTTASGSLHVPMSNLGEEEAAELFATGHWSVEGDSLVFSGNPAVPEPGTALLALLMVVAGWMKASFRRILSSDSP